MSRPLWFVAGAGAGAYVVIRARRAAESLTVDSLKDRFDGLRTGARMFRDEVAQGQVDKETELRDRLGLRPHGLPELSSGVDPAAGEPARPTKGN